MSGRSRTTQRDGLWQKAGVVAGILGFIAAALVFFLPQPLPFLPWADEGTTPVPAQTDGQPPSSSVSAVPATAPASGGRYLTGEAGLPVLAGGGQIRKDGRDLTMPCGTGQSDDRFRQVEFGLPAPYARFAAQVRVGGRGDPESTAGIEVFVHDRYDRADRVREVSQIVVPLGAAADLEGDIEGARVLVLRITCASNQLQVTFSSPSVAG